MPEGDQTPSVGGFADLVAESIAVGMPAELIEDGDPALASPVVGRTAYRIVREALTNVRKHAPGARVTVRVELRRGAGADHGPQHAPPTSRRRATAWRRTGSGMGSRSLRRRIEVVHGTLRAGPAHRTAGSASRRRCPHTCRPRESAV